MADRDPCQGGNPIKSVLTLLTTRLPNRRNLAEEAGCLQRATTVTIRNTSLNQIFPQDFNPEAHYCMAGADKSQRNSAVANTLFCTATLRSQFPPYVVDSLRTEKAPAHNVWMSECDSSSTPDEVLNIYCLFYEDTFIVRPQETASVFTTRLALHIV